MKNLITYILVLWALFAGLLHAQTLFNNGAKLYISNGANIYISGNYKDTTNINQGVIKLHGTMWVKKDWINYSDSGVFIADTSGIIKNRNQFGQVILDNNKISQSIYGANPTYFENLKLSGSDKTLYVTNCKLRGVLTLNSVLDLNKNRFIIDNSSPSAINYKSGYIISETTPSEGLGEIKWNIGDSLGSYIIPFGSGNGGDDLNLTLKTKTNGSSDGSVTFATYPTDYLKLPYPSIVTNLTGLNAQNIVDRFWIIRPEYNFKPGINLIFSYLEKDLDETFNVNIKESSLTARRYNTIQNDWRDIAPECTVDTKYKKLYVNNLLSKDFYEPWILLTDEKLATMYIPKAFTPNGDGKNETFMPVSVSIDPTYYNMYIYDRWGKLIYNTTDINKPWDGKVKGSSQICPEGVYVYYILYRDLVSRVINEYYGSVTIVR
ncbi:MAG: gliding motility-associated C-terminal domain-containing protein [Bacteroidota bacterium]|nr:gliding motility-associated C-terminal domain-containing protein [Bacteroidota bacterium]